MMETCANLASMPCTRDALWGGRLILWQPARGQGYRFNLDPVLLANFVPPSEHVLDLGAGCGVLGLLLLASGRAQRVTAVEVQPALAALAQRNAEENGFAAQFQVVCRDVRAAALPPVDGVVFNPPYFPLATSRPSPDQGRDWARREHHGTLADFARLSLGALTPDGFAAAVVPMARAAELQGHWARAGAHVHRRRTVTPRAGAAAHHALLEARRQAGACQEEAPLHVHVGPGRDFSDEVGRWVAGPPNGSPLGQAAV